ncbi:universal stress protein [Roseobacter weihaiensis]|uniref:universal stress protein n=1 Tax=Roseobacter weihaiensis TaxID=2763262 RepID=UPI001D0BA0C9|nr:universal stress protein [Roseobacter sp. H9]
MTQDPDESMVPPVLRPIARVLVVVDPDETASHLRAAAELAAQHGADLDVLSCIEPPPDLAVIARAAGLTEDAVLKGMAEERRKRVTEQIARLLPDKAPQLHLAVGKTFIEIIHHVDRLDIDVVVKMAEPLSGLHGFLFASTDQHLMRKCPCPVWLHLPDTPAKPRRILAAVDVDDWDATEPETLADLNRRVIEMSIRLASGPDAIVHVLHAWEVIGEGLIWAFASRVDPRLAAERYVNEIMSTRRRSLEALVQPFQEGLQGRDPRLAVHLVRGPAHAVIAEQAKHLSADTIVMGTVARTGLSGVIIGNTAENILNSVERSVVTVKPEGFISPIMVR